VAKLVAMKRLGFIFRFSLAPLLCRCFVLAASQALPAQGAQNQAPKENTTRTKVVLLGTGGLHPIPSVPVRLRPSSLTRAPISSISDQVWCAALRRRFLSFTWRRSNPLT